MKMKGLLSVLAIWWTFVGMGQTFSNDRAKFVKELQSALSTYGKGEYSDFVKNQLAPSLLESGAFSEKYFTTMVTTCNLLMTKRMDIYPDVYNYVFSVYSFVDTKQ